MKKTLYTLFLLISLSIVAFSCKKSEKSTTNPVVTAKTPPDVSNFLVSSIVPYVPGSQGSVLLSSSSLAAGNYTVYYHCSYNNRLNNLAATVTLAAGTATLVTPVLDTARFTIVTVDSIRNADNLTAALTDNNEATLVVGTGFLNSSLTNTDSFKAVAVWSDTTGTMLRIFAFAYPPTGRLHRVVNLYLRNYNNTGISSNFTVANPIAGCNYSSELPGSAQSTYSIYGNITITATFPLLTGNFNITCLDSTKLIGNFSCQPPQ